MRNIGLLLGEIAVFVGLILIYIAVKISSKKKKEIRILKKFLYIEIFN